MDVCSDSIRLKVKMLRKIPIYFYGVQIKVPCLFYIYLKVNQRYMVVYLLNVPRLDDRFNFRYNILIKG